MGINISKKYQPLNQVILKNMYRLYIGTRLFQPGSAAFSNIIQNDTMNVMQTDMLTTATIADTPENALTTDSPYG